MPNDGNKIYSQTQNGKRYGVSLDQDVCVVLGLPQNTYLWTAATSSRVNPDSLIKPVPVSTPPNLTTAGKTDAVVKSELLQHLSTLYYGYEIPAVNPTPGKTLTAEDFQAITSGAVWIPKPWALANYAVLDHFDGYNHTVRYEQYLWGNLTITPKKWSLIINVDMYSDSDLVFPGNMLNFANWRVAVFVYRKGTSGAYVPVWGGCWTGLTSAYFQVGNDQSDSIIQGDTTYAALALMTDKAFDNHEVTTAGQYTWVSNNFRSLFYCKPDAKPWAEATTKPNLSDWQEAAADFTAFVAWSGTTQSGQGRQFIYNIRVRSSFEARSFRVTAKVVWKYGSTTGESSSYLALANNGYVITTNEVTTSSGTYYQSAPLSGTAAAAPYNSARTYYLRIQVDFGTTGSTGQEFITRDVLIGDNLPPEAAD